MIEHQDPLMMSILKVVLDIAVVASAVYAIWTGCIASAIASCSFNMIRNRVY